MWAPCWPKPPNDETIRKYGGVSSITRHNKRNLFSIFRRKPTICQHAVPIEYRCLKDNSVCKGQCGIQTDQAAK
jgi:hypothetical protein